MNNSPKPLLKAGIISDIQALPSRHDWGMHNFNAALKLLSKKGIDLLISAGDIAENGNPETYALYWELIAENFPGKLPEHTGCEGNHDCNGKDEFPVAFARACKGLKRECVNPEHRVIGGYDFINFATFDKHHYSPGELPALERELEKAVARDPRKPVFVITHYPPADTVTGSHDNCGSQELLQVFRKFPQVVPLSGHTHCPLADERTIWQGEFTAIETSTLAYGCATEEKCFNTVGGILPFAREATEFLYMEIFEEKVMIYRYNAADGRELGPAWQIDLPFDPAQARYTAEKRQAQSRAPEFASNADVLLRYDYGYCYIIFDRPVKGDFAHFYDVEFSFFDEEKQEWLAPLSYHYISDFYRLACNRQEKIYLKLPETLEENRLCRFRVYAVETFGKRSLPLEMECRIWPGYKFKEAKGLYPQE